MRVSRVTFSADETQGLNERPQWRAIILWVQALFEIRHGKG